ncbi:MAG: hypothetical protein ONB48_03190 [candidate division KSB1 bacterium]|nr:hypothetical protein [candidate division KSB1 bacterium]MDZ7275657.1 hypothetical protein [candidate division KSB1 bacterium]MDZ7284652.1 hypothetical protein [candidate division KSB1 bacterium]MDZ7297929.1 hypothetical protein [candidate division KSB1 bacterium]MDZ7307106.1 hypothetical protein [candidate division KSB1 bacterium]
MSAFPHYPLEAVAQVFVGLARHGNVLSSQKYGLQMSLIGMKAIGESGVDWEAIETVSLAPGVDAASSQVAAGDVLLTCRGTAVRVALLPERAAGMIIDSNLIAIRCGPQLLPELLVAFLRHPAGRELLERASQSTTRQKNLTLKAVRRIMLPVPPPGRQEQLVKLLRAAERHHHLALAAATQRLALAHNLVVHTLLENGG